LLQAENNQGGMRVLLSNPRTTLSFRNPILNTAEDTVITPGYFY